MGARIFGWVLPAFLLAGAAHAAPEPMPIDRTTALQASVEDLARSALAAIAPRFVEVQRPDFVGMMGPDAPLRGLRFATAARMAGETGLCEATTAWIGFDASASPVETATVYKVVGDLAPLPDMWNSAYEAELTRKCAAAGRVLPENGSDFGQTGFFRVSKGAGDRAWVGPRTLQLAIAGAKAGSPVICLPEPDDDAGFLGDLAKDDPEVIEDRENREGCARAGATLASLSLDRLLGVDIGPCPDLAEKVRCVSASFLRYAYGNHQALWLVSLRYQMGPDRDVTSVEAVTLKSSFNVYD